MNSKQCTERSRLSKISVLLPLPSLISILPYISLPSSSQPSKVSVLLAVPSLLFSTTIDQPQVHLIKDQLKLIKFDDNDNDDNFDNGHDEVINSEPIQIKFEVEKLIRVVQPA